MGETLGSQTVLTKQLRIAQLAVEAPTMVFTTLAHHIDMDWLKEAYRRTRKDGAVGVDGQTAQEYAANLEANLRSLLERFKSGRYVAPPVRRVHIPKGDGKQTRPIGIPAFEDKVLQRAVVMVLEPIYEQDFLPCSFGFRPGRSAHQALDDFRQRIMKMGGGWVLEIDIRKFFDTLGHEHLREIIRHRIGDGVLLRTIGKWLNAGVQEAGCLSYPEAGSPQGGVISPILANAYLHEVLDTWFERTVKARLKGPAFMTRYADDAVLVFKEESDARRVLDVLPKRFGKYGLTLHPEKTQLVRFQRPQRRGEEDSGAKPGTFDLLGFTHLWAVRVDDMLAGKSFTAAGASGETRMAALESIYGGKFVDNLTKEAIVKTMSQAGAGQRGIVMGVNRKGAHYFNVVNQKGQIRFLDGQTGTAADPTKFDTFRLLRTNPTP